MQNSYLIRQKERIPRNLEYLKPWFTNLNPENPKDWNYASMSLYSFLYWTKMRAKTVQVDSDPQLVHFLEKFVMHLV